MNRQIWFLSCLVVVGLVSVHTRASTFFSGRIDVDPSAAGGTPKSGVKQLGLLGAGVGYHNEWTGGGNLAGVGNKVTALGVVPITTARTGNLLQSLHTGLNLVAVYAFEGVSEAVPSGPFGTRSSFDPSMSVPAGSLPGRYAGGVVRIYDRSDSLSGVTPGLIATDASTWVQDLSNPTAGLLAELSIGARAAGYRQGAPRGSSTTIPVVVDSDAVNTSPMDTTGALLAAVADFLLELHPPGVGAAGSGALFSNADILSDPGMTAQSAPDLLLRIEQTPQAPGAQPALGSADLSLLDQLFDALLDAIAPGDHLFSDPAQGGNGFDMSQNFATGDFSAENTGGTAVPGRRFQVLQGPEPLSMLVWLVAGLAGLATSRAWSRRR